MLVSSRLLPYEYQNNNIFPFLLQGLTLYWISAWFLSPNTDFRLFYVAALAIAIGRSGQDPVLKSFLRDQFRIKKSQHKREKIKLLFKCLLAHCLCFGNHHRFWSFKCTHMEKKIPGFHTSYGCKSVVVHVRIHLLRPRKTNQELIY